jgi:hypothetical protein
MSENHQTELLAYNDEQLQFRAECFENCINQMTEEALKMQAKGLCLGYEKNEMLVQATKALHRCRTEQARRTEAARIKNETNRN